jgi:hypothetical protein
MAFNLQEKWCIFDLITLVLYFLFYLEHSSNHHYHIYNFIYNKYMLRIPIRLSLIPWIIL